MNWQPKTTPPNTTPIKIELTASSLEKISRLDDKITALIDSGSFGEKCPSYWAKVINRCVLPRGHGGEHVFGFPESQLVELFDELMDLRGRNKT